MISEELERHAVSKIKKALEKAKAEKLGLVQMVPPLREIQEADAVCAAAYHRTNVVDVPLDYLLAHKIVTMDERHPATDPFKLLRTRILQQTRLKGWNTIQVTGFEQAEGKSTVAANLAVSLAIDTRQTTLLVDLDFRRPAIHKLLGLGSGIRGLKSYFLEEADLEELIICPGIEKFTVLPAGGSLPNAAELMGSAAMEALVKELKERYRDRYIIFDTPAVNLCPDPLIFSEYVDAIVLVARAARTSRESIKSAMDLVPREKVLGIVLNDCRDFEFSKYSYRLEQ